MFLKDDGSCFGFGANTFNQLVLKEQEDIHEPKLLFEDEDLILIIGGEVKRTWRADEHHNYPLTFQRAVLALVLCLRRRKEETGLRVPKFILFEIIKWVDF